MNTYPPREAWRGGGRARAHRFTLHWHMPSGSYPCLLGPCPRYVHLPSLGSRACKQCLVPSSQHSGKVHYFLQAREPRSGTRTESHSELQGRVPDKLDGRLGPSHSLGLPLPCLWAAPSPRAPSTPPPLQLPYLPCAAAKTPDSSQHAPHFPTPRLLFKLFQLPGAPLSNSVCPDPRPSRLAQMPFPSWRALSALTLGGSRAVP